MAILKMTMALAFAAVISGCTELGLDSDAERGAAGAVAGAVVADAFGVDPLTGAIIGGAAGVFCDEANVPGCILR